MSPYAGATLLLMTALAGILAFVASLDGVLVGHEQSEE